MRTTRHRSIALDRRRAGVAGLAALVGPGRLGRLGGLSVSGLLGLSAGAAAAQTELEATAEPAAVPLPAPRLGGAGSLEDALQRRRSVRAFAPTPLALAELAQLLWAAQGRSNTPGHRTAPSAGALYPLELFVVAGRVEGLAPGLYRYRSDGHVLLSAAIAPTGDLRPAVAAATRAQGWVADAPALLVITADPRRIAQRYGERAERFVALEAGAAVQNVYLQATVRDLATVVMGAFDEARLRAALALPDEHMPLALMPLGHPR